MVETDLTNPTQSIHNQNKQEKGCQNHPSHVQTPTINPHNSPFPTPPSWIRSSAHVHRPSRIESPNSVEGPNCSSTPSLCFVTPSSHHSHPSLLSFSPYSLRLPSGRSVGPGPRLSRALRCVSPGEDTGGGFFRKQPPRQGDERLSVHRSLQTASRTLQREEWAWLRNLRSRGRAAEAPQRLRGGERGAPQPVGAAPRVPVGGRWWAL